MFEPRIHGNKVVWRENDGTGTVLKMYDLAWLGTTQEAVVIAGGGPVPAPLNVDIGDRFVVWFEFVGTQYQPHLYDLRAYDLATETPFVVASLTSMGEIHAATSGAWIVWQTLNMDASTSRIEALNVDTGESRVIAEDGTLPRWPSIDGDLVAYSSHAAGNYDVSVYRLSTGETFAITNAPGDQFLNDVFGSLVAWVDMSAGNANIFVAGLTFVSPVSSSCTIVPDGLVGCYEFNGSANDGSGNGNNGALNGGPTYTADKFGNANGAIVLDGVDDYVSLSNEGNFDLTKLSIVAIVRVPDYLKDNWIINKGPYFGNYTLRIEDDQGYWPGYASYVHEIDRTILLGNWSAVSSDQPLPLNEFFHITVTMDPAGGFNAYINGQLKQSFSNPQPPQLNDSQVTIGAGGYYGLSDFFVGAIDDIRIYNRALTAAEVGELYSKTFNTAPWADAGPDQAVTLLGSTVTLNGSASYDLEGDPLTYSWTLIQKPVGSVATLPDPSSPTPTFIADVQGSYEAELVVSDPWVQSAPDTVTVSFENIKPVANAGGNQAVSVGDIVVLDGSGSSDANGDPLTYAWSFTSIPDGSSAILSGAGTSFASFTADLPGTYVVSLVVNDGFIDSDPDTANITAVAAQSAAQGVLINATSVINSLDPGVFKNSNLVNALTNKINAVLAMIDQGLYQEALDKLQNDILGKTDGCATSGSPDKNDWITDCGAQSQVYPLIMQTIELLRRLV